MTVCTELEAEIRRLHYAEHWPVGTIARQLGVHDDVVRRVTGLLTPRAKGPPRPRLVDPFVEVIGQTLERYPKLRSTRLCDMLKSRGFAGSERTLREYVRQVRPRPRHEAFLRTNPLMGEESQVDWAHVGELPVAGGTRVLWLFVMVLSYSRAMWAEFVRDLSASTVMRSLSRASSYFGGATRQWLFDNPRTIVLERRGDAVRFHPLLVELSGHFRVQLKLCLPRKANQKGRVERLIRFVRERFLAGRTILSVEQGNREILDFIENIAHKRPHPTIPGKSVEEVFIEEKSRLLLLPDRTPSTDVVTPVAVDKTAFVRFDTNCYSVPSGYVRSTLTLVADDASVRVVAKDKVVAEHQRCWGRKQVIEDLAHRKEILEQKRAAAAAKGKDRLAALVPDIERLYERWLLGGRNLGQMTMRTIKLLDRYGDDIFKAAVREVIDNGAHDPGAIAVRCEHLRTKDSRPIPLDVILPDHVNDRDVIPHDLERYDETAKRRRRD